MKKIDKAYIVIGLLLAAVLIWGSPAFAQEAAKQTDDGACHIKTTPGGENGHYTCPAPANGERPHIVVDVYDDEKFEEKLAPPSAAPITVVKGSDFDLRFGVSAGSLFPGHPSMAIGGGLDFEIGHTDSMWRLQAALGAGNCAGSSHNGDGVAVNSGLALMASMGEHLRIGPGVDLLYCSDIASHPAEKANERLVGPSFRAEYTSGYVSFTAWVGAGLDTMPLPGSRQTTLVPSGGVKVTLWTSPPAKKHKK